MTRSPISLSAVTAAAVATVALVGPVAAGSPGKRIEAKRAAVAAHAPARVLPALTFDYARPARDGRLTVRLG
jgi:hypothetical protein